MSVYFLREDRPFGGRIKIGYTAIDPRQRRDALQTGNPTKLCILSVIPGTMQDEADLHKQFSALRLEGEWFAPGADLLLCIEQSLRADDDRMPLDDLRLVWIIRGGVRDAIEQARDVSRVVVLAVLLQLAEMADASGVVPSISSVALGKRAMSNERTTRRALDALQAAGLIAVQPVSGAASIFALTHKTIPPTWFTPLCREPHRSA